MLDLKKENIKGYLEFQPMDTSNRTLLWSFYWGYIIVAVPTALFGIYSQITKPIILPFTVFLGVWAVYLSIGTDKKQENLTLFQGVICLSISVIYMLAAYKILSTIMIVSMVAVVGILGLYVIGAVLNIMNVLRLIKKGYYQAKKKQVGSTGIAIVMGLVGMGIARAMKGRISQDSVVIILASGLMLFSFFGLIGTQNFLKFYLMKSLDK